MQRPPQRGTPAQWRTRRGTARREGRYSLGPFHSPLSRVVVVVVVVDIARRLRYSYSWRATSVSGNVTAARSSEWAQHFSNASCFLSYLG